MLTPCMPHVPHAVQLYTAFRGDDGKREIIKLALDSLPPGGGGMLHIMHKIRTDINTTDDAADVELPMHEHEWDKSLVNFLSVFMDRRELIGTDRREKFKIFVKGHQVQPYTISRELAEGLNFSRTYKSHDKKFQATISVGFTAKDQNNKPTIEDSKPSGYCVCVNGMMVDAFQKFSQSRLTYKSIKDSIIKGRKGIVAIAEIKVNPGFTLKEAGLETLPSKMSFMPTDAYRKLKDRMMEAVNELIKNTYKEDGDEVQHPTGRGSGSTARPRADGSRRHGSIVGGGGSSGARGRSFKSPAPVGGSKRKSRVESEQEIAEDEVALSTQRASSRDARASSRRGEIVQELDAEAEDAEEEEIQLRVSKRSKGVANAINSASTTATSSDDTTNSAVVSGAAASSSTTAIVVVAADPRAWKALPTKKDMAIFYKVVTTLRRAAAFGEQCPGVKDADAKAFFEAEYAKLNSGSFDKDALFGKNSFLGD